MSEFSSITPSETETSEVVSSVQHLAIEYSGSGELGANLANLVMKIRDLDLGLSLATNVAEKDKALKELIRLVSEAEALLVRFLAKIQEYPKYSRSAKIFFAFLAVVRGLDFERVLRAEASRKSGESEAENITLALEIARKTIRSCTEELKLERLGQKVKGNPEQEKNLKIAKLYNTEYESKLDSIISGLVQHVSGREDANYLMAMSELCGLEAEWKEMLNRWTVNSPNKFNALTGFASRLRGVVKKRISDLELFTNN